MLLLPWNSDAACGNDRGYLCDHPLVPDSLGGDSFLVSAPDSLALAGRDTRGTYAMPEPTDHVVGTLTDS